uniref:Protein transport protein Sec61 subunit beta n=2 Tax=Aegilops tauschii subsp. strangulata TaxID=200361 RepID=A0A453JHE4_AEGTS
MFGFVSIGSEFGFVDSGWVIHNTLYVLVIYDSVTSLLIRTHTSMQINKNKMVINGDAPARGSAAAAASLRRRRTTSGAAGGGGGASTMLQFYTDEAAGRKMSPNAVLIMSIGFVAVVAVLHVFGKLYR